MSSAIVPFQNLLGTIQKGPLFVKLSIMLPTMLASTAHLKQHAPTLEQTKIKTLLVQLLTFRICPDHLKKQQQKIYIYSH